MLEAEASNLNGALHRYIMGNCCSSNEPLPYYLHPIPAEFTVYRGAGMIFDNGRTILCGAEPGKVKKGRPPALYGIGGKREATDANYRETAAREVIEELFGIHRPSRELIERLLGSCTGPHEETKVDDYVMLRYRFEDLEAMLAILGDQHSPFYTRMPQSVSELVLARRAPATAEMTHLCLLPMVTPSLRISRDLAGDIARLTADFAINV